MTGISEEKEDYGVQAPFLLGNARACAVFTYITGEVCSQGEAHRQGKTLIIWIPEKTMPPSWS